MAIHFFQEGVSYRVLKKRVLGLWLKKAAKEHGHHIDVVNIILCSDGFLLEINHQYLNHDYYTDVITFSYHKRGQALTGDIYISIDRVKEDAKNFSISTEEELHRVMIHGFLHLMGFNDGKQKEKNEMTQWENQHLAELNTLFHVKQ